MNVYPLKRRKLGQLAFVAFLLGPSACSLPLPECEDYTPLSISDMREDQQSGCFALTQVVVAAKTPSDTAPTLFVQDPAGGDFSAIMASCSEKAAFPCAPSVANQLKTLLPGAAVTLRGYFTHGQESGFQGFAIDEVDIDGTTLAVPPPVQVNLADIARSARIPAKWFQLVEALVPSADPLVMYDFSPAPFQLTGPCPAYSGFGMIQSSQMNTQVEGCQGNANPLPLSTFSEGEILIGRKFFDIFTHSADCACAQIAGQRLLSVTSTLSGLIRGVVILDTDDSTADAFQVFEPIANSWFPITEG